MFLQKLNMVLGHLLFIFFMYFSNFSFGKSNPVKDWLTSQMLDPKTTHLLISHIKNPERFWSWNALESIAALETKKITIASEMLHDYPPGFQFETQLLGPQIRSERGRRVVSEACLKFGLDPSFDSERMWFLTNELKRTEIQSIQGDLLVDLAFRFADPSLESQDALNTWIRSHLSNRQIELQGRVRRQKCPDTLNLLLAKSPSKSTLALLNELMRASDEATVTRFESIFVKSKVTDTSMSRIASSFNELLSDGRLSPEFESSLRVLARSNGSTVRGISSKDGPHTFIGYFSAEGNIYSAVIQSAQLPPKRQLAELQFSTLIKTEPTEKTNP